MSQDDLIRAMRRCFTAELDQVVEAADAGHGPPMVVASWSLSDRDREALLRYGVPINRGDSRGVQLVGDVQSELDPTVVVGDRRGYRLGSHWWRRLAALAGSGEVVAAVPDDSDDPLGKLAVGASPTYVNSSVARFVDIAWRWHCLAPLFHAADYGSAFYEGTEEFLEVLPALDPALAEEEEYPWWRSLVLGW
jgi:SUKH-4 immunity protein